MNNLALPGTAMPHVLWQLQGSQEAVWEGEVDAQGNVQKHFKEFKLAEPGKMTREEYDGFVRDTVNFLDYVGEPVQVKRAIARLRRDLLPRILHAACLRAQEGILEGRQVSAGLP